MKIFIRIVLGLLTVILGISILCTDVMSFIKPISTLYLLNPLTLFFSGFAIAILFLAVYWAICRKWGMFTLCIFALLVSIPNILKTYSLNPKYEVKSEKGSISIMSYNVHLFSFFENGAVIGDSILNYISEQNTDVVCMQEFFYYKDGKHTLQYIKNKLKHYKYCHVEILNKNRRYVKGLAIFSKFPIVSTEKIELNALYHGAVNSSVVMGKDTVNVVNCYLQSNQLTKEDKRVVPELISQVTDTVSGLKAKIYDKLIKAGMERTRQADIIRNYTRDMRSNAIICGDMNDIPASYVYRRIRGTLNDSFLMLPAKDLGSTYHEGFYNFRIDYIFITDNIIPLEFSTDKQEMSDHYPIILNFKIN
ncbi:MAG: endonuclease/exonuclease/phosphatase family protein [Paludibacteraceae bacterium]|nr:endonuclease/exonuclease/phosphatase family protein [Paludibacteraceae bacterium]